MADLYAVLTGDLVRSSGRGPDALAAAHSALQGAAERLARAPWGDDAAVAGPLEIFRGDAWQLVLGGPRRALRSALCLRSALLAGGHGDTRVAIGVDRIARLDRRRPSRSTGPAFERSGRSLDDLPRRFRMALDVDPGRYPDAHWQGVAAHLCDALVRRWRGRQAEAVFLALLHPDETHAALAARLRPPVSQQAVSKTLAGAGWAALAELLETLETASAPDGL